MSEARFYTNAFQMGNFIYLREVEGNKRRNLKVPYKPSLFLPSKEKETKYKTIHGDPLDRIDFGSIYEAKEFQKKYDNVRGMQIFGFEQFLYPFLNEEYPDEIHFDKSKINIANIDIEVSSSDGFPDPYIASKEITAIAVKINDVMHEFTYLDCELDTKEVILHKCQDEEDLLLSFLSLWEDSNIDIITGWSIDDFDIPYLINRIRNILEGKHAERLSPWGIIHDRSVNVLNKKKTMYDIKGITALDYLRLYKKFTYTNQESYKLDHIAYVELKEKKLDYSEYDNLQGLLENNPQKYIEYNIKDVNLVDALDKRLKFIDLALTMAYNAKVTYDDIFSPVKTWDVLIHNHILKEGVIVPPKACHEKYNEFLGAYVKNPRPGMYDWIVSFDVTSLYPSLIVQHNISPEKYVGKLKKSFTIEELLDGALEDEDLIEMMSEGNYTITANSCVWRQDSRGFLPVLVVKMMEDRARFKKELKAAKKKNIESPSKALEDEIARLDMLQMAMKIFLNSLFGILGSPYFRYYSIDFAEAITSTGQLTIRWIEQRLNKYLNDAMNTNKDYCIAIDTDSVLMNLGDVVKKAWPDKSIPEVVNSLDKLCAKKLEPELEKYFEELSKYTNSGKPFLRMKREAIANKGIWTAKKRYVLNLYDNEGVRFKEPKLKMMGIEAVKSSTPEVCRDKIKESLKIIMMGNEESLQNYIRDFREEFCSLPFDKIAAPRGVHGLSKYTNFENVRSGNGGVVYKTGTPIHVRGALLYNDLLKKKKLTNKYPLIQEGEKLKLCYMKVPNPLKENVIAISTILPKEFGLEQYIDYELQFDKTFLEPVMLILNAIGWHSEKVSTLEGFFG